MITNMATQKRPAKAKAQVKVKDLKPKKDAKAGWDIKANQKI